jgi:hypothetical protein
MNEGVKQLVRENNPAIQGIIISSLVILGGIFTKDFTLKLWEMLLEIKNPIDSWLLILGGFSSLFYFVSMRVNQKSEVREFQGVFQEWFITPVKKSELSKECFNISIIIFLIFLSRGFYILIKFLLQSA